MKKHAATSCAVIFIAIVGITSVSHAVQSPDPCAGRIPIVVDKDLIITAEPTLRNALADYDNPNNIVGNDYILCFQFPSGPLSLDDPIVFPAHAPTDPTKGVIINGLDLEVDDQYSTNHPSNPYFVQMQYGWATIKLMNLSLVDAQNTLALIGTQAEIINPTITNDLTDNVPGVVGINLDSTNNVKISNGTISGFEECIDMADARNIEINNMKISDCGEGVHIATSQNIKIKGSTIEKNDVGIGVYGGTDILFGAEDAVNFYEPDGVTLKDANIIKEGGMGIYIAQGQKIQFGFNEIFKNDRVAPTYLNAIVIDDGQNADVVAPETQLYDYEDKQYALHCPKDGSASAIKFDKTSGSIQLYAADETTGQASRFMMTCIPNAEGFCELTGLPGWTRLDVSSEYCKMFDENDNKLKITAIFTDQSSSSMLMPLVLVEGVPPVIFAGGGVVQTTPGSEATAESSVDSGDFHVEEAAGGSATPEGGGSEMTTMAAQGVGGGCGRGSQLIPNEVHKTVAPSLGLWWIIFSVGLIASIRHLRVHSRHKK